MLITFVIIYARKFLSQGVVILFDLLTLKVQAGLLQFGAVWGVTSGVSKP